MCMIGLVYYTKNLNHSPITEQQHIKTKHDSRSNTRLSATEEYPHFFPPIQYNCDSFATQLPKDFDIIATGGYSGKETPYQIDNSGHQAYRYDVKVQHAKPLVLVLGAYEPTIWDIAWDKNTKIVGVIATGYHHQVVTGLPKNIPVLVSTYESGGCSYAYVDERQTEKINALTQKVLKRDAQLIVPAMGDRIIIGRVDTTQQLISSDDTTLQDVINQDAPLAGQAGIDDAVSKGLLRPATEADFQQLSSSVNMMYVHLHSSYVVLAPMQIPAGLYGADSVSFLVPKGVPEPIGNLGHSEIYHLK